MSGPHRDLIRLDSDEVRDLLHACRKVQVATIDRDGTPHVVPMFYVVRDDRIAFWTYAKSQKIVNLRRDQRITCLVETGDITEEVRFAQIRGVAEIVEDPKAVASVGRELYRKYVGELDEESAVRQRRRGAKRVVVIVHPDRIVTWDHRKLPVNREGLTE